MVYTILISIVFIAEIIIAITLIQVLLRFDKAVLELDETITATKPGIKDICELSRKISEQWEILANDFVEKTKKDSEEFLLKQLSKGLMGLLVLNLNFKLVKKIRNSKITKTIAQGLSILENMV
jgi:uncharacterized protein YoxC